MFKSVTLLSRVMLCSAIGLFAGYSSFATHIVGTDLYYTHISGSTYKITLVAYGDCGPASAGSFSTLPISTPQICIFNGGTSVASINLTLDTAGTEITHLCPTDSSQCLSLTSLIPGVKKFRYSGSYTLPATSAVWRFIYSGNNVTGSAAGRAGAITNIAGTSVIQLIDSLNNMTSENSSPLLTVSQQTYFCNSTHNVYVPGASDPESDSLHFELITAGNGTTSCGTVGGAVSYISPYTGTSPLRVVSPDSFSLNPLTGALFFNPLAQRAVIVYNIREFRSGVLVGTSQREMTVLSVNCGSLPCVTSLNQQSIAQSENLDIYPNPANEELHIQQGKNKYSSLTISNTVGQVLITQQITGESTELNIKSLAAGLYYINLKGDKGTVTRNFIKK